MRQPLSIPCSPCAVTSSLSDGFAVGLVGRVHPLADTSCYQAHGFGKLRRKPGQSPANLIFAVLVFARTKGMTAKLWQSLHLLLVMQPMLHSWRQDQAAQQHCLCIASSTHACSIRPYSSGVYQQHVWFFLFFYFLGFLGVFSSYCMPQHKPRSAWHDIIL